MKKQISIAIKNELAVSIENKFPEGDLAEILMALDYLKRNEIEDCLKQDTWGLFISCIRRKFKNTKNRASRLQ